MDMVENHMILESYPTLRDAMITYGVDQNGMTLEYRKDSISVPRKTLFAEEKIVDYLTPDYMIEPSIG
jgi:hypothetical protein